MKKSPMLQSQFQTREQPQRGPQERPSLSELLRILRLFAAISAIASPNSGVAEISDIPDLDFDFVPSFGCRILDFGFGLAMTAEGTSGLKALRRSRLSADVSASNCGDVAAIPSAGGVTS
jgi:hypothetical protein